MENVEIGNWMKDDCTLYGLEVLNKSPFGNLFFFFKQVK